MPGDSLQDLPPGCPQFPISTDVQPDPADIAFVDNVWREDFCGQRIGNHHLLIRLPENLRRRLGNAKTGKEPPRLPFIGPAVRR